MGPSAVYVPRPGSRVEVLDGILRQAVDRAWVDGYSLYRSAVDQVVDPRHHRPSDPIGTRSGDRTGGAEPLKQQPPEVRLPDSNSNGRHLVSAGQLLGPTTPGRNELCPCRSGRKVKRCLHQWGDSSPGFPSDFDDVATPKMVSEDKTEDRVHRAWLLLAVGDDRQPGGNEGYDDAPESHYSWDSTVPN